MNFHLDIQLQGDLLLMIATGTVSFDTALGSWEQILDAATQHHVNRILVDTLAVDGILSTTERYGLGVEVAELAARRKMNPKIAIVGKPPVADGFIALVAQNRGLTAAIFRNRPEALRWLEAMRSPQATTD